MSVHIAPCFAGPIDVVGDIHGEIEPLMQLLAQLGYDSRGRHAHRRLVFIGDLIDRGPDSPAVLEFVRELVMAEQAQCLLGNHELLLLQGESKEGCRWYADPQHPEQQAGGRFAHSRPAPPALKPLWREFVASLPLALERDDLRLVHACWQPSAIEALRTDDRSVLEIYTAYERSIETALQQEGWLDREAEEMREHALALSSAEGRPPLLPAMAMTSLRRNLDHPIKVLTYGPERRADQPYYVMERWRMCQRQRWWNDYADAVPVVFGHYWRQLQPFSLVRLAPRMPSVFDVMQPNQWLGPAGMAFCTDFSVGARFVERKAGVQSFETHLAALRWPERQLWLETGHYG